MRVNRRGFPKGPGSHMWYNHAIFPVSKERAFELQETLRGLGAVLIEWRSYQGGSYHITWKSRSRKPELDGSLW